MNGFGLGIAVGLIVFEHVPGDGDKLARGGDDGDIAILLSGDFAEEMAERSGMRVDVLGGLHHEPAGMGTALFGNASVVAVVAGLVCGGNKSEISCGFVGGLEAFDVAKCGEKGLCDWEVDARKGHQEFDLRVEISEFGEIEGGAFDLDFDVVEEAELTIEGVTSVGIERQGAEPSEVVGGEEIAAGSGDESLMKDGVRAVFDACSVGNKHGAFCGEMAEALGVRWRNPDGRKEVDAEKLSENERVDFVGFDFGLGDGFGAEGIGDCDGGTERLEQSGDRPGVGGGFESDVAICEVVGDGEMGDGLAGCRKTITAEEFAVFVEDAGFDFLLVEVETGETL